MNKSGKKKLLILSLVVMVAFAMMPVSSFATEAVSTADQPAAEQQAAQDEAEAKAKEQQAEEEKAKEQQAAEEAAKQKAAAEEQARQEAAKQAGAESENEQSSGAAKDPSKENDNAAAGADDTADYWNYENKETKTVDNSVSIPDGSYVPDSFSSSRATGLLTSSSTASSRSLMRSTEISGWLTHSFKLRPPMAVTVKSST